MNERQLEDALRDWPLDEPPTGFTQSVMDRIGPRQASVPAARSVAPKFRLTWMDYALGLFLGLFPALAFAASAFLPKTFFLYLEYLWLLLRSPAYEPVLLALLGAAAMLFIVFLVSLRYAFPRQLMAIYE